MGLGLIDWEGADARQRYAFWNISHQQFWYGDASLLVGFRLMPLEPQFQKTVEKKYPVSGEGFPGSGSGPGQAPRPVTPQGPPVRQ
jgi:hypothetical protein